MAAVDTQQAYSKVCEKLKELSALQGISGLLGWDEMVMMPEGAAESRGAQKAALAGVIYDKKTDQQLGQLLEALQAAGGAGLDAHARATLRDAATEYRRTTAIPKELAQRMAKLETDAYHAWVEARKASDFSKFAPFLQQWVDVSREKARLIDATRPAYDVLLEGMTTARLDEVFTKVRDGLVPLIAAVKARASAVDAGWITQKGEYDRARQADMCREIALDLGFDIKKGRLDVSVHPFTGGAHPTDVRMTTRFKADDLLEGLTGAVHETGHALYEQGRDLAYDGLPVNSAMSMGVHESQSLLWERMVALSEPFTEYLQPKMARYFPEQLGQASPQDLWAAMNAIREPSLIRVEADEATYPMHVILRYELERGLIDGSIAVDDVPRLWNEKMEKYLGCTPPSDAQGCLQDIHWSGGAFSYFPTYTLGAMYATQIFEAAKKEIPGLEDQIKEGQFSRLKAWLNEKIHKVGSLYPSGDELMVAVTGSPLDPSVFLSYLTAKFTKLYKL